MLRLVLAVEDPGEDIVSVGNLAAVGAFPGYDVPGITVDQFAGYSGASQIQGDAVMAVSGIARLRIYAVKTLPIPGQGQGDLPAGPGAEGIQLPQQAKIQLCAGKFCRQRPQDPLLGGDRVFL